MNIKQLKQLLDDASGGDETKEVIIVWSGVKKKIKDVKTIHPCMVELQVN